ncbi:flagellar biosynthesis protein FlhF [Xenophilus aerolatus]|nr:flagellar biosynthesis protein FlhF [Xenophilus aerolatus]
MNIQRFQASTAREALALARAVFGDNALILANRQLDSGEVEVTATSEEALGELDAPRAAPVAAPVSAVPPARAPAAAATPVPPAKDSSIAADTEQLAMSTLSFQDYVRERMARRQAEAEPAPQAPVRRAATAASNGAAAAAPTPAFPASQAAAPAPAREALADRRPPADEADERPASRPIAAMPVQAQAAGPDLGGVMAELQAMKSLMEERFTTLSWMSQARQEPVRSNLLLKLIRAGFSPALSRTLLERVTQEMSPAEAVRDVMDTIGRMLRVDAGPGLEQAGGVYALVGATGVGKTTTIAKLATLCAREHGAQSVGLITLDTYRAGAHEQLRTYGRSINVVAHLAHDRAALLELLGLFGRKKLVLVDTTGVAPRDPRRVDQLGMLDIPQLQRVLVLNAGAHGDTQDDIAGAFGASQAVISKVDEAVKLAPVLDAAIRHQLVVTGVSCGQRVPDDWRAPDADLLVREALRSSGRTAFEPRSAADMDFFLSPSQCATAD